MQFLTWPECESWSKYRPPTSLAHFTLRLPYPEKAYRYLFFARTMVDFLPQELPILLWLDEWGVWPSSENLHLYSALRQCAGDGRSLMEAPGHLFKSHERDDLVTYLQIAMLNGWGGRVLSQVDSASVRFSHDEYMEFCSASNQKLQETAKTLE